MKELRLELIKYDIELHKSVVPFAATLTYRGVSFEYTVNSVLQKCALMFYVAIVSELVRTGAVDSFLCEDVLVPKCIVAGMPHWGGIKD